MTAPPSASPDTLADLHAYSDWANRLILSWWRGLPVREAAPLRLLSHILRAEAVWLDRLTGKSPNPDIWASLSDEELHRFPDDHRARLRVILSGGAALDRRQSFPYRRFSGEAMESTVADILTHLVTHGVHHRAQIAAWSVAHGHKSPGVDYRAPLITGFR